jgi:predicted metal-dependent phosphotriesterase family hydrolase
VQIDLAFDRADKVIIFCEMKRHQARLVLVIDEALSKQIQVSESICRVFNVELSRAPIRKFPSPIGWNPSPERVVEPL